jgi:hypothetical protein
MKLKEVLETIGALPSEADPGFYIMRNEDGTITFLIIWVDDILIASKTLSAVTGFKSKLMSAFEARDLGEAKVFVGIEIKRC